MYRIGKFSVILLVFAALIAILLPNSIHAQTDNSGDLAIVGNDGNIYLDFTLSEKEGRVKDHGFLWRVPQDAIANLYKKTQLIDLSEKWMDH